MWPIKNIEAKTFYFPPTLHRISFMFFQVLSALPILMALSSPRGQSLAATRGVFSLASLDEHRHGQTCSNIQKLWKSVEIHGLSVQK